MFSSAPCSTTGWGTWRINPLHGCARDADSAGMRGFARRRLRRPGLLGRFTALSLLAVVVMGLALAKTLKNQIQDRARTNASQQAALIARFGFQPQLSGTDLSRPLPLAVSDLLDTQLRAGYESDDVLEISILSRGGRVVYSSDPDRIGRHVDDEGLAAGLADRRRTRVATDAQGRRCIDADVPLHTRDDGIVGGFLEARLNSAPPAASSSATPAACTWCSRSRSSSCGPRCTGSRRPRRGSFASSPLATPTRPGTTA